MRLVNLVGNRPSAIPDGFQAVFHQAVTIKTDYVNYYLSARNQPMLLSILGHI